MMIMNKVSRTLMLMGLSALLVAASAAAQTALPDHEGQADRPHAGADIHDARSAADMPGPAPKSGSAGRISIGCFSSLNEEHAFWKSVRAFMEAVARDLRIELRWHFAKHDQVRGRQQIRQELSGPHPIDAALIVNYKNQGEHFLTFLDQHRIRPGPAPRSLCRGHASCAILSQKAVTSRRNVSAPSAARAMVVS